MIRSEVKKWAAVIREAGITHQYSYYGNNQSGTGLVKSYQRSTDAFMTEVTNCELGSSEGLAVEDAAAVQPAAAAAAFWGSGGVAGVQEVSSSLESDGGASLKRVSGALGSTLGAGVEGA
jgi:hypothetical protein